MNLTRKIVIVLTVLLGTLGTKAANYAWPANYEGVMLQGFSWDSYSDTKWTNLESQADELSKYFKLIWIPNSGKCGSGNNMGYMPQYWFTNHNSSFGTEAELRSMIKTFKAKGTGFIEDVVVNHRNGVTNWTDFPVEQWNGQTWKIGPEGICCTDEVSRASGQAKPTGAADTGEDFDGCRDLDHTNANVQNNIKNYCKCLLEDFGYVGFRYDMVKGYAGKYTKIYNEYSKPTYSVGEYWDGSYDKVAAWIEATGKQSAAFDFPGKYAINEAFANNDMTKLVWKANGTTDQPAGMIHFGYSQYAVTFVDNHDTYRDGSKFNGNVVAANAFILCSPGTPCVFLPHYKQNKAAIQTLINVRNSVGVHNNSAVKVLQSSRDCYMAEVTGSKGTLVVKIGSAQASPSGYSNSDIKASGNGYCVWTKVGVGPTPNPNPDPNPGDMPSALYVLGNIDGAQWSTSNGITMTKSGKTFVANNVKLTPASGENKCYFTFVTALGADWDAVNCGGDRYGAPSKNLPVSVGGSAAMKRYVVDVDCSAAESWEIASGTYTITADFESMTVKVSGMGSPDPNPNPDPNPTDGVTIYFDNSVKNWATPYIYYWGGDSKPDWPGVPMNKLTGNIYKYVCPNGTTGVIFNAGDGDASKTADLTAVNNHIYTTNGDQGEYHSDNPGPNPNPNPAGMPNQLFVLGNIEGAQWDTTNGVPMTKNGNTFEAKGVVLTPAVADIDANCYFTFVSALGMDWDEVNGAGNRYGAPAKDTPLTVGGSAQMVEYVVDVNNSAAESWMVPAGTYNITADFSDMTVRIASASGVDVFEMELTAPVYFDMNGVRVDHPQKGIPYIVVRGAKATKQVM